MSDAYSHILLPPFSLQITHQHVALGIKAPLYPVVHKNLMAAIAETLGDDVITEEVGGAWSQAILVEK